VGFEEKQISKDATISVYDDNDSKTAIGDDGQEIQKHNVVDQSFSQLLKPDGFV